MLELNSSMLFKHSLQLALQKWEPAGRICDFGNFFNGLAKSPRVVRSSWILDECNLCCKIVQYCILSEVCVLKTVTPSTVSPQMWCINGIKGWFYTQPDLLARFCKVNLSNAKKFDRIFFPGLIDLTVIKSHYGWFKCDRRWLLFAYEVINSM